MSSICLCMIVRDEAAVIARCLDSVRALIDTWVICDTGSADRTPELIAESLEGVPGRLHRRPWRDFGHNRSELMRLARGSADYLLLLDADMTVLGGDQALPELTADSYFVRHLGEPEYWVKRLVRGDRDWLYVGSTHEYLACDGSDDEERLTTITIDHHADGGARSDKLERDLRLLGKDLAGDESNARAVFYLAQTYRDLGRIDQAAELYERRAAMGGWAEEVFYSLFQAGVLHAELGDWPLGMSQLIQAFEYRPARLEPLYELASRLRIRGEYETAHIFATRGLGRTMPPDILFVHPWVYRWGLLFEYSITAYWTGDTRSALRACNQLLSLSDLPPAYRAQASANKRFCVDRLRQTHGSAPGAATTTPAGRPAGDKPKG